jgi:cytidylate kinase
MAATGLALGGIVGVAHAEEGADQQVDKVNKSIAAAVSAVEEARVAIENGKQLVALIPADSELVGEVKQMLVAASENWKVAITALDGAKESASKIESASSSELAQDYTLLATVNAGVALSGAKVVQTGLIFVDAAANNKTEALDIIRMAMQDSLAAASQVQFNYERVKTLIAEKYSK